LTSADDYVTLRDMKRRNPTASRTAPRRATPTTVLLTVEAGARWLGLSRDALWSRLQLGQLPYVKLGKRVYLVPEDVEAALRQHTRPATG